MNLCLLYLFIFEQIYLQKGYIMEKIAIPTVNDTVDDHFGHAELFLIYQVSSNKEIESKEFYVPAKGCGCKSGLAGDLKNIGVTTLLAGNMGRGAQNTLKSNDIDVITGFSGKADDAVQKWLSGDFARTYELCSGGHNGHACNHHDH